MINYENICIWQKFTTYSKQKECLQLGEKNETMKEKWKKWFFTEDKIQLVNKWKDA